MNTIYISVVLKFSIRDFPLNLYEIFLVIHQVVNKLGKLLAVEFIKRLEKEADRSLKERGCVHHSYQERTFQGILGKTTLRFLKVKHPNGKIKYALEEKVTVPAYVRYTEDAFEPGLGLLPHVSYKRSSLEVQRINGSSPAKSTLHRRLHAIASQIEAHPAEKVYGYRYLIVDGTGARFQRRIRGKPKKVTTYPGELRIVYASKGIGESFDVIGRWTNTSWKKIAHTVYQRIDERDLHVLISDGGPGIEDAFLKSHMKYQRCSVHAWRNLRAFLYQDGVKKDAQQSIYKIFRDTPVFRYSKKMTMESLKSEDSALVERELHTSEGHLLHLQDLLKGKGYHKTAAYVANLSQPLLTFLREWLTTGEAHPSTSNIAESRFSLIKNRIARIGRRWSEPGLKRWLDLAIYKLFPGYDWNELWKTLLPITGNLSCEIVSIQ